jgi:hypothetical protein
MKRREFIAATAALLVPPRRSWAQETHHPPFIRSMIVVLRSASPIPVSANAPLLDAELHFEGFP